ncbi:hypothetical protein PIB30_055112 [Stylosanthes scabra]|uniref:ENTH domain-containing protein n=1 Tax=Stylosanthes scabra TaxID=79078 RepID=A0ABU6UHR2_9FABA|nr:hypothetical protein [Stylosanthes scabra]
MASSTIRKAIGVVKDQTSISIAKVAGNLAPELEVLVVKATSHEEVPADDKYMREILSLTSHSRGYVNACLITISKRLSKTRDWIVAVKSLMLVHRLLVDGHPLFEEELVYATRRGMRILNMSDFRDEAHSSSWDHAGFVRVYASYLDEKVEFVAYQRKLKSGGGGAEGEFREEFGSGIGRRTRSYGDVSESYNGRENNQRNEVVTPVREMGSERVLERLKHLLRILDRVLGCRPSGAAKSSRLVLVALYQVVRDSFKVYVELCDVLGVLLDRFTEMEYAHCVKAFDCYVGAAKMMDELVGFYGWCRDVGIARSSEYPEVQRITDKLLSTLEGFLKEKNNRPKSPDRNIEQTKVIVKEKEPEINEMKALPAPENFTPAPPSFVAQPKLAAPTHKETNDLVDLRDNGNSADEQGNKLALALFNGQAAVRGEGSWEAFPSNGEPEVTSAWQTPAAEPGKADWELALVETMQAVGHQDPFAASLAVPPPSYVQIADMERKQHLLVQEQQLWQQYGRDGMHGQVGLARVAGSGYYVAGPQPVTMPYGMPQFGVGGGMGQPGGGYYPHAPF